MSIEVEYNQNVSTKYKALRVADFTPASQPSLPSDSSDNGAQDHNEEGSHTMKINIHNIRKICGAIINHQYVQAVFFLLIVINGILLGLTTFPIVRHNPSVETVFETLDRIFLVLFTIESYMQLTYHGTKLFLDSWLLFDFIVVTLSWVLSSFPIILVFRIFRILRLIKFFRPLRDVVRAMITVIPRMIAICGLLFLVFYIFAVMFTNLLKDISRAGELSDDYFGSLGTTFFTLFMMMTLEWSDVAREVMEIYPWMCILFILYVLASAFIMFNLVIAVICDAIAEVNEDDDSSEANKDHDIVSTHLKVKTLSTKIKRMKSTQKKIQDSIEYLTFHLQVKPGIPLK